MQLVDKQFREGSSLHTTLLILLFLKVSCGRGQRGNTPCFSNKIQIKIQIKPINKYTILQYFFIMILYNTMNANHHVPAELKTSTFSLNSVIKDRQVTSFIPINGSNGYSNQKKEIEFQLSHRNLFDMTTLAMSFELSGTKADGSDIYFEDLASNVIDTVEVYLADELIERVEKYNLLTQAMVLASANDSYYEHELNVNQGAHVYSKNGATPRQGQFMVNFDVLGISKIRQFLPIYHQNMRVVIRLADPQVCSTAGPGETYNLDAVKMFVDTVEPVDSYRQRLEALVRSESGISFPLQSYDVKTRAFQADMNFNLSYAELDSVFGIIKTDQTNVSEAPASVTSLSMNMNGKYLGSTSQGLQGIVQIYNAMRKSLALPHDAHGSTMLDFKTYTQEFTLLGVDCEKSINDHSVFRNGINTAELGYSLDVEVGFPNPPANTKFHLICLHRKLVKMANNAVSVME